MPPHGRPASVWPDITSRRHSNEHDLLRDRLPIDESAQLASQLPELLRGIYYEGWVPAHTPRTYHDLAEFLDRMAAAAHLGGETEASFAAHAAARVLRSHVSPGELADVIAVLPPPVREVFET